MFRTVTTFQPSKSSTRGVRSHFYNCLRMFVRVFVYVRESYGVLKASLWGRLGVSLIALKATPTPFCSSTRENCFSLTHTHTYTNTCMVCVYKYRHTAVPCSSPGNNLFFPTSTQMKIYRRTSERVQIMFCRDEMMKNNARRYDVGFVGASKPRVSPEVCFHFWISSMY